jgi:hypothetical protein
MSDTSAPIATAGAKITRSDDAPSRSSTRSYGLTTLMAIEANTLEMAE